MLQKIKRLLLFSYISRSDLKAVRPQIMEENRKFCIIWSAVNGLFWIYCLIMTFINPVYHQCRTIYAVALAVCLVVLFLSVFVAPKRPKLIRALAITLDEVLLISGILIARHLAPQTIVVFASVLIVPVVFITDTLSTVLLLVINILVFTLIGSRTMEPDTYRWVLSNLCIFSLVGIMIGHFVNRARFERYIFAQSKAELAEIQARYAHYDQLTGLQNRRAYEETIEEFSKELPAGCCVIAADVNGLKGTNDTLGHQAGDELIIGAAEGLRRSFPETDRIYRTGGDEFAVILTDEGYDVDAALEQLKKYTAEWKGQYISGCSVSAGFATAKEFDHIDDILMAADSRMYEAKRNYYQSIGRDRRRR